MTRGSPPRSTRLGRLVRGLRLDRNPLRRGSDRAETVMLAALLAAFLGGAPFAAHVAGSWTYANSAREALAQQASFRQVPATLQQATVSWGAGEYGYVADARWTAPDGQVRTGQVFVPTARAAGSTVMTWVDQAGQLTDAPLRPSQVASRADAARALIIVAVVVTLVIVGWIGRWALDRRRLAGWDAEWLVAGSRWSPRRPGPL